MTRVKSSHFIPTDSSRVESAKIATRVRVFDSTRYNTEGLAENCLPQPMMANRRLLGKTHAIAISSCGFLYDIFTTNLCIFLDFLRTLVSLVCVCK